MHCGKQCGKQVHNSETTPQPQLAFEDFKVGQAFRSPCKTLTMELIRRYADVSGDKNPIHLDPEFAKKTPFRGTIAHGTLLAAMASGFAYEEGLLGPNILALESSSEKFLQPARPHDRIFAEVTIASADPSAGKRYGRVVWDTLVYKEVDSQSPVLLVKIEWTTLMFKQAFLPKTRTL
ncbi:MAG: MaoC family dehydratase [Planctomycetes bacterium]|nr:MaoC family dehydratase [Planctomycetota bacterium]MBT5119751.1 MaoC family dehydratase [Planctomycetota bacterium]